MERPWYLFKVLNSDYWHSLRLMKTVIFWRRVKVFKMGVTLCWILELWRWNPVSILASGVLQSVNWRNVLVYESLDITVWWWFSADMNHWLWSLLKWLNLHRLLKFLYDASVHYIQSLLHLVYVNLTLNMIETVNKTCFEKLHNSLQCLPEFLELSFNLHLKKIYFTQPLIYWVDNWFLGQNCWNIIFIYISTCVYEFLEMEKILFERNVLWTTCYLS